ncbi:required for meiotic nuclear division protein 1 homolog [Hylaeus anthracinus]|uniref:required for meiotic nuclear division protein 1 homolog n=1 Tax=Hylaeus anthracinus TaxID=313031 RepID=UPI0023B965E5|nr:required for meiotic nuclear division protein 1 homolog [Hylaeus anthracinus]
MNFSAIQKCILSKCKINFNTYRKIHTTFINHTVLIKPTFCTRLNWQCNYKNLLHITKLQFGSVKPNVELPASSVNYSALQLKKRPKKRQKPISTEDHIGEWNILALSTAEEYDLEGLVQALLEQNLYVPDTISSTTSSLPDVIHAVAKYEIETEPREIFFFREGAIVMWNISTYESSNILEFIKEYEDNRYFENIVQAESEVMSYSYADIGKRSHIKNGHIILALTATNLDKYTFSNAMAQSVKLGIWEASLDNYIHSVEFVTDDLKYGRKLKMTQREVLKNQGELFALRHSINLSSDLLDTPDFYWERDDLAILYQQTCAYFNITKRTRVINEKINHCVELVGILSSHLSDRHHIRLEWMIIILIMVEVAFEILHYIDKYFT